jgi:hypothetical protein
VKAVDVLLDGDLLHHAGNANVRRQRQLHQDAVDARVLVESLDAREQLAFADADRELDQLRADADLLAAGDLAADVTARRRIVADQHDCQRRRHLIARLEILDAYAVFGPQFLGNRFAVDDFGGHEGDS